MILVDDVIPESIDSTATFIQQLSTLVEGGISHNVEQLVLRFMVDFQGCPLCRASAGAMCNTYGGQNLRRTHLARLEFTQAQCRLAISWAILENRRRDADEELG